MLLSFIKAEDRTGHAVSDGNPKTPETEGDVLTLPHLDWNFWTPEPSLTRKQQEKAGGRLSSQTHESTGVLFPLARWKVRQTEWQWACLWPPGHAKAGYCCLLSWLKRWHNEQCFSCKLTICLSHSCVCREQSALNTAFWSQIPNYHVLRLQNPLPAAYSSFIGIQKYVLLQKVNISHL